MSTLSDDELARIKRELLDQVLDAGAEPYVGHRSIYAVIRDNVVSSTVAATSSDTEVTAAGATVLTLASVTGLSAGLKAQLDVDDARETVTVRAVSGSTISVVCRKAHSGTYPVELESPLTLVRGILSDLAALEQIHTQESWSTAGLKRVDEIEWATASGGSADQVQVQRGRLRAELAAVIGLRGLLAQTQNTRIEVY